MNLMTKYDLGDFVAPVLDPMVRMQITKITLYLDGGYQYETARFYEGILHINNWFENELEAVE